MATMAYCFGCRARREIKNPKPTTLRNGRSALSGVCPTCGTKVFRIEGRKSGQATG